ncbi:MAG: single-stranded DNA-binding protein [Clostridium sp.]|uniref:DUF1413 domain-containing protein n=1 Tax=Clostridium sp. TaxID=1506 RepID=UPI002A88D03B|nr:single-stranded DNA-binding protein [Clostridium sp.]MDY5098827.1 DUF1413 domain-containing protein [Clostridium sp.]
MPVISIRVTEEQKLELERKLSESNMSSLNSYILSLILPNSVSTNKNLLTHKMILSKLQNYKSGESFNIPELFSKTEWDSFSNTVSVGRTFRLAEKDKNSLVSKKVIFVEKKSGYPAVYKVK